MLSFPTQILQLYPLVYPEYSNFHHHGRERLEKTFPSSSSHVERCDVEILKRLSGLWEIDFWERRPTWTWTWDSPKIYFGRISAMVDVGWARKLILESKLVI